MGGGYFHIFHNIVYHAHPGDNCTKGLAKEMHVSLSIIKVTVVRSSLFTLQPTDTRQDITSPLGGHGDHSQIPSPHLNYFSEL